VESAEERSLKNEICAQERTILLQSKIEAVKDALKSLENKVITTKLIKDTIDIDSEG